MTSLRRTTLMVLTPWCLAAEMSSLPRTLLAAFLGKKKRLGISQGHDTLCSQGLKSIA